MLTAQKHAVTAGQATPRVSGANFDTLPDSAFIRESQLVQSPKRPEAQAPLPFSAPTLWRKVKAGTFPAPVKLSERVTAWNVGSVRAWIASHCATQQTGTQAKSREGAQ